MIRQLSKNKILITKADGIYKTEFIGTSHRFQESKPFFFNRCCASYFLCYINFLKCSVNRCMFSVCVMVKKRSNLTTGIALSNCHRRPQVPSQKFFDCTQIYFQLRPDQQPFMVFIYLFFLADHRATDFTLSNICGTVTKNSSHLSTVIFTTERFMRAE